MPNDRLNYGEVIEGLKKGYLYEREGWNGRGMFIFLVAASTFTDLREPLLSIMGEGTEVNYRAHIDMKDATGCVVPWVASQTDQLAEDWLRTIPPPSRRKAT